MPATSRTSSRRSTRAPASRPPSCVKRFSRPSPPTPKETKQTRGQTRLSRHAQEVFQEDVGGMLFANSQTFTPIRKNVVGYKIHGFGGQPYFGVGLAK